MKKLTSVLLCLVLVLSLCVTATAAETTHMEASAVVDAASATVTVVVSAKQSTANARLHIAFDPDYLTYQSIGSELAVASARAEAGHVTIGLAGANADAIQTGAELVKITFAMTGLWDETALTLAMETHNGTKLEESLTLTAVGPGYRFEDVQAQQWFYEAVDALAANGTIKGISATHFGPALAMNRASFVTMLGRLEGIAEEPTETAFTDVPTNSFYSAHVAWAADNGIVRGVSSTLFAPTSSLTRRQMVLFLYRYAKYLDMDVSVKDPTILAAYPDGLDLQGESLEAFSWAVEQGIIVGMDLKLMPEGITNRAQVAVMLYRFFFEKNA